MLINGHYGNYQLIELLIDPYEEATYEIEFVSLITINNNKIVYCQNRPIAPDAQPWFSFVCVATTNKHVPSINIITDGEKFYLRPAAMRNINRISETFKEQLIEEIYKFVSGL